MPMKKAVDIDRHLYDAYIYVDGYRVYRVEGNDVLVEIYMDSPRISPEVFWRDYAYSGEADEWFPQLDPDSIQFSVSSGQYNIGSDIRAYGKLSNASEVVAKKIKEHMKHRRAIKKKVGALNKQIAEMQKEVQELNQSVSRTNIPL